MPEETGVMLADSSLYKEYQALLGEILKHKRTESEKAGRDIGFEQALTDWMLNHRSNWRRGRESNSVRARQQPKMSLEQSDLDTPK